MRNCLLVFFLMPAPFLGGCGCINWGAHVLAPSIPMKTVEAEFDGLVGQTVAVIVFAGPATQLDYSMAQLEITDAVGAELRRNVKKITVIDPRRIIRYQDENPRWDAMPPEKLCGVFNADYVLLISLMEFSTRERGSVHLARGRISAQVGVYKANRPGAGGANPVWRTGPIRVAYPADSMGRLADDDWRIRVETEKRFAAELVKKFYKHKVPKES